MDKIFYSENSRRVRKRLGLSQEQAADELGVGLSTYGKFERCEVKLFNDNLTALARLANMTEVEILAGGKISGSRDTTLSIDYGADEKLTELRHYYEDRLKEKDEYIETLLALLRDLRSRS